MTSTPVRRVASSETAQTIGRYRLCFEIASGGMATLYLARAEGPSGFEKLVALKRIHPQLEKDPSVVHMFLDEARIASRISHANVCTVFDYGREGGVSFIAMEYLTGEPLSRILRAVQGAPAEVAALLPRIAARVAADISEGLHAAHELRDERNEPLHVVHRDISPDNLFITYDGVAKVVDFGIASARHRIHQTTTGELKGKYAYMAPEQLTEEPIDRRTDVWALGVVLWECMTRHRLFRKRSRAETLFAVVSAPIPAPSTIAPEAPADLDKIVLRCLERDPAARYPDARELGRDLTRWLGKQEETVGLADVAEFMARLFPGEAERKRQLVEVARAPREPEEMVTVGARPEPASAHSEVRYTRRWSRRSLVATIALACLVGVPVGLAAYSWMQEQRALPDAERSTQRSEAPATDEGLVAAPPDEPEREGERQVADPPEVPATTEALPAPERRRASARGCVAIATPAGWATVHERGRRLGQAPARFCMPAGRHVLEVRHLGRSPGKRIVVRVEPGATARVVVEPAG